MTPNPKTWNLQFVEEQKKSAERIGEIASFLSRKFISSADMQAVNFTVGW